MIGFYIFATTSISVQFNKSRLIYYQPTLILQQYKQQHLMDSEQLKPILPENKILQKPQVYFLIGGPGSGKDTQAQRLIQDYRFKHISTGDLLRNQLNKGGELAQQIQNCMREGRLFTSALVVDLIQKNISTFGNQKYLLNGFPRNQENWNVFMEKLQEKVQICQMIYFDCPENVLVQRMLERAKNSNRPDDNHESIIKRAETFKNQTLPILQKFKNNNLIQIDATQSKQDVYAHIRMELSLHNVYPPKPAEMIFVLGGPGSGKGTQCNILVNKYHFIHLSTGDLIRQEVQKGSPLGYQLKEIMKEGKLISSQVMVRLIQQKMDQANYSGKYLLDGFPRGQQNMDVWQRAMSKWVNLRTVLYFECNMEQLKRRLIERGRTSGRVDDNEESITKRLNAFEQYTKPVVSYYEENKKINKIQTNRQISVISQQIEAHLQKLDIIHINQ